MGKDQMWYHRRWIQFHSSKIAEISLFMEMKYVLSNDKLAMETIKGSSAEATDAAIIILQVFQWS